MGVFNPAFSIGTSESVLKMKTRNLLTIAISAFVALNFTSCKENEDDEPFHFPAEQVELLLPDGVVVDTTIRKKDIVSSTNPNYTVVVMVGTEKDNLSTFMGNDKCILKIDQKYYWQDYQITQLHCNI